MYQHAPTNQPHTTTTAAGAATYLKGRPPRPATGTPALTARPAGAAPRPRAMVLAQAVRTANKVRARLEKAVLREVGLSFTAYDVLSLACQSGTIEGRLVMEVVGIAPSTLKLAMRTLTERDLVRRGHQIDDRRRLVLHPTPAGVALARRVSADFTAEEDKVLSRLGITRPEQFTRALGALGRLCQNGDQAAAITGQRRP